MMWYCAAKPPYYKVKLIPDETGDYWCFFDKRYAEYHNIYYSQELVQMCYPYYLSIYESKGYGHLMRCRFEVLEENIMGWSI